MSDLLIGVLMFIIFITFYIRAYLFTYVKRRGEDVYLYEILMSAYSSEFISQLSKKKETDSKFLLYISIYNRLTILLYALFFAAGVAIISNYLVNK